MFPKKENLFVEILKDGWQEFKAIHSSFSTEYYDSIIEKSINCRDPKFSYVEYRCGDCGIGSHVVGFSCKSKFCIHCARKSSNDFIEEMMGKLHAGVVYRHLILTIPEQFRTIFYKNRKDSDLYSRFMNLANEYIQDVFRTVTKIKKLKIGCVVVIHTAGRSGSYNPHLHVIVMNGGIDLDTGKWIDLPYFKYEGFLPKKWQYHLLEMMKKFDPSEKMLALIKKLWKLYPKGFVNNFKKGDVPNELEYLIKYLAKYISKPSISITAIKHFDKKKKIVTYTYKDHRTGQKIETSCSTINFIGRLAQQIFPKGFHRIKYFGLQSPSSYTKNKKIVSDGLKKSGRKLVSDDSFVAYAVGAWKWTKDPRKCECCGGELIVWKIWSKKYGIIYDAALELMKNGVDPPAVATFSEEIIENMHEFLNLREEQLSFLY